MQHVVESRRCRDTSKTTPKTIAPFLPLQAISPMATATTATATAAASARSLAPSQVLPGRHLSSAPRPHTSLFSPPIAPAAGDRARAVGLRVRAGEGKVGGFVSPVSRSSVAPAIDFLTLCHQLKKTKRKGWINHGIEDAESISDHMYQMALMALIVGDLPPDVNRERCIKLAIVHDIAEAIVGDITPSDGIPKAEKSRRERAALNEMCEVLGGGMRANEIKELWEEYENNSSVEANIVKDFDKVEMILQALEYENEHGKVLDEFFLSTAGKFQTDIGKSWATEIITRRKTVTEN